MRGKLREWMGRARAWFGEWVRAHVILTLPMRVEPLALWRVTYESKGLEHRVVFMRNGARFAHGFALTRERAYRNARRDGRWAMRALRYQKRWGVAS